MQTITRDTVRDARAKQDVTLVEVLGEDQYNEFHLPGAINVPLDEQFERRIQEKIPDKSENVIVYCKDTQCQASSKAARRMEDIGYSNVYDYEAGKTDWKQAGLPVQT